MPVYYFYFLRRMKKPNPELSIPVDWRVAMVVTRAPSEPIKSHLTWRITPKDSKGRARVPVRFLIPYLTIIFACGVAAIICEANPATWGYFWFTMINMD